MSFYRSYVRLFEMVTTFEYMTFNLSKEISRNIKEHFLISTFALLETENSDTDHFRLFRHFNFPCQVKSMTYINRKNHHMSHVGRFFWF